MLKRLARREEILRRPDNMLAKHDHAVKYARLNRPGLAILTRGLDRGRAGRPDIIRGQVEHLLEMPLLPVITIAKLDSGQKFLTLRIARVIPAIGRQEVITRGAFEVINTKHARHGGSPGRPTGRPIR